MIVTITSHIRKKNINVTISFSDKFWPPNPPPKTFKL